MLLCSLHCLTQCRLRTSLNGCWNKSAHLRCGRLPSPYRRSSFAVSTLSREAAQRLPSTSCLTSRRQIRPCRFGPSSSRSFHLPISRTTTRRVKTVFFAMRHALDDMEARQQCMDIMRELFRQFMSVLIQEKTRVEEEHIYLDPRISFQKIDRYFLSGCACAFFQVATDVYTDLRYNQEEWD